VCVCVYEIQDKCLGSHFPLHDMFYVNVYGMTTFPVKFGENYPISKATC